MWGLTVRATLSQHKESHGSHGNFYEGEQEHCCSVPVGALYGGQRVSQWHKLCWSRAGVTLAGTTGQPRQSRSFLVPPPTLLTSCACIFTLVHLFFLIMVLLCLGVVVFQLQLPCWDLLSLQWQVCPGVSQHYTFQPRCSEL